MVAVAAAPPAVSAHRLGVRTRVGRVPWVPSRGGCGCGGPRLLLRSGGEMSVPRRADIGRGAARGVEVVRRVGCETEGGSALRRDNDANLE